MSETPHIERTLADWKTQHQARLGRCVELWVVTHAEFGELAGRWPGNWGAPPGPDVVGPSAWEGLPFFFVADGPGARQAIIDECAPPGGAKELDQWFRARPERHVLMEGPFAVREVSSDERALMNNYRGVIQPLPAAPDSNGTWDFLLRLTDGVPSLADDGDVLENPGPDPRAHKCPLCRGSGFQERGIVSGMRYEIACDCALGRRDSNLCVVMPNHGMLVGPGTRASHRRRGNVGGRDRNANNARHLMAVEDVLATLDY